MQIVDVVCFGFKGCIFGRVFLYDGTPEVDFDIPRLIFLVLLDSLIRIECLAYVQQDTMPVVKFVGIAGSPPTGGARRGPYFSTGYLFYALDVG
jgi:hypothetical protein